MNQVQKQKLPAIEAIQYNSRLYIKLNELWQALHQSFNSTHNWQVNTNILDEITYKHVSNWESFLKEEFKSVISKYNNLLASRLDKILWKIVMITPSCSLHICNMDYMVKGNFFYNTMIGCAIVVSVSALYNRHYFLTFSSCFVISFNTCTLYVFSWLIGIYSCRYSLISLHFTN